VAFRRMMCSKVSATLANIKLRKAENRPCQPGLLHLHSFQAKRLSESHRSARNIAKDQEQRGLEGKMSEKD
jgi:hypothetical protein